MGMCNRVGYEPKVVMTGGVALNANMVDALSKEMGCRNRGRTALPGRGRHRRSSFCL